MRLNTKEEALAELKARDKDATIATQAAQIDALVTAITDARSHYYAGEYQSCCDTLTAALAAVGEKKP